MNREQGTLRDASELLKAGAPTPKDAEIAALEAAGADIWEILQIPQDVRDTFSIIGQVVGTVSSVISWVGTVQTVLKLAGLVNAAPNPYETLYQRLQSDLRTLLAATIAGATEERLRDVADKAAIARTAGIHANEHLLLGRPTDAFHVNRLALADRDSLQVMQVLADQDWWHRTYDPTRSVVRGKSLIKFGLPDHPEDRWENVIKPLAPSGGLIWDYRHILPAYLQAMAARIVVLKARSANVGEFLQLADGEVRGYIAFLSQQHARIKNGIVRSKPLPEQYPGDGWQIIVASTGAVELYSGTHMWNTWGPYLPSLPNPPKTYAEAVTRHKAEIELRWWKVYQAVGLVELQRVIDELHKLLLRPCTIVPGSVASASSALVGCASAEPTHHVFVTGSDGGMHILWKPDREAGWQWHNAGTPPGARLESYHYPAVTASGQDAGRRIHGFTQAGNGRLHVYHWNGSGWQWSDQGRPETGIAWGPTATTFWQHGAQHHRAYVVGAGKLAANWWDGARWQWIDLGKAPQISQFGSYGLESAPAAVTYRYNGRMLDDVYVVAPGGLYEHTWYEDGRRAWSKPPKPSHVILKGDPAAVAYEQDGRPIVHVFAVDIHGALHSLEWNSGWRWVEHGAPPGTAIKTEGVSQQVKAATLRYGSHAQHVCAVVAGKNGRIYARNKPGGNWSWYDLGPLPGTTPRAILGITAYVKNGSYPGIDIFVRGENRRVYVTELSFAGAWTDLGVR